MREIGETLIISKPSISTFSRKLWKSETLFILDLYLCSLEIKEVGKCKIFQKKKNVANPCHDLNQQDCKVATQIFSGFVGGFGGRRDDVTLRLEGKDSSCAPARFGFHSRRASMSELIITEGA